MDARGDRLLRGVLLIALAVGLSDRVLAQCTGEEKLAAKATAKGASQKVSAKVTLAVPGATVTFCLDGADCEDRSVKNSGSAKNKWKGVALGVHVVTATLSCGTVLSETVGSPIGQTYYVAPNGDNGHAGTREAPWLTLQFAAGRAMAGDMVVALPGTYAGFATVRSGEKDRPITFKAEGPGVVIDHGADRDLILDYLDHYIVIDGFEVTNAGRAGIAILGEPKNPTRGVVIRNCHCHDNEVWGIFTGYAEDILIENNRCSGSRVEHGIYVSNSADRPILRGNVCHDNAASGLQINADPRLPGDKIISEAVVEKNVIYRNGVRGGAAINLASVRDSRIANNLLYENHASGIASWDDGAGNKWGSKGNRYYHNTIVMASDGRFAFVLINGSTDADLRGNILLHLGSRGTIETDSSSTPGLVSDFNVVKPLFSLDEKWINLGEWQAKGFDANSFVDTAEALFVAPGSDFHLKAGASAIDKAPALPGISDDFEGDPRPQGQAADIGCDERKP